MKNWILLVSWLMPAIAFGQSLNITGVPNPSIIHSWHPAAFPDYALVDDASSDNFPGFNMSGVSAISITWSAPPGKMFEVTAPPAVLGGVTLKFGASFQGGDGSGLSLNSQNISCNVVSGTAPSFGGGYTYHYYNPSSGVMDFGVSAAIGTNTSTFMFTSVTLTVQFTGSSTATFGREYNWEPYFVILYGGNTNDSTDPGSLLTLQGIPNTNGYSLDWFKIAGGGGTSSGDIYSVSDTIGQHDAGGTFNGGDYTVTYGFWSLQGQAATAEQIPTVPTIISQPQDDFIYLGSPAMFNVIVSGTPPFFYQWQKNGVNLTDGGNISGSATSNLVLTTTSTSDLADYSCVIRNAYGNVTNSSAAMLALGTAPTISVQPLNQFVSVGSPANFSVVASGSPPLAYQWQLAIGGNLADGTNVSGTTTSNMTVIATSSVILASNAYRVIITNNFGAITSSVAVIQPYQYVYSAKSQGTNFVCNVTDMIPISPISQFSYYLATSTNLMAPLSGWTIVATNFGLIGFNFTNALNHSLPAQFFAALIPPAQLQANNYYSEIPTITDSGATATNVSFTVNWTTSEYTTGGLFWGPGTSTPNTFPEGLVYSTNHSITINGLQPSTTYSYIMWGHNTAGTLYRSSRRQITTTSQ